MKRSAWQNVLIAAGLGGVLFIAGFVILGVFAPGYSFLRDAISALEFTSLGLGQRVNFFFFGVLLCAFAVALRRELVSGPAAIVLPVFQGLSGMAVIGDAIFIHPPLHLVCDLVAFNACMVVLFGFAWAFRRDARWKGWTEYSIATAVLMMGFLAAFGVANGHGGPAGLYEKLATLIRTIWSVLLVAKLFAGASLNHKLAIAVTETS